MTNKEALLHLLKKYSYREGIFTLSSGIISNYYIDVRRTSMNGSGAALIGEVFYEETCDHNVHAIGGMQVGSVPLTTATLIGYIKRATILNGFWVREVAKGHGTKGLIEGQLYSCQKVIIIDDVMTTGSSTMKAIQAVEEIGCEVMAIIGLVDRLQGAAELFREYNYRSIFTIKDFQ